MEDGLVKAYSDNLPHVDFDMVCAFTNKNQCYINVEVKHGKTKRSTRDSYGDNAVGYVQLKREDTVCTVKAKVTPEHKIYKKNYNVVVVVNEEDQEVLECKCTDCSASEGGCKHGIAFLFWLHRRSEEPASTSKDCYWKKSMLTSVKDNKIASIKELVDKKIPPLPDFHGQYIEKVKSLDFAGGICDFFKPCDFESLSLHHMVIKYTSGKHDKCPDAFLSFLKNEMTEEECKKATTATQEQSKSTLWYNLRYARVTASHLYECARCKTVDGVLVEKILGASKPFQSSSMERGLRLEEEVLNIISQRKKISISKSGLVLCKEFPIFGASPDGLSAEFSIEIKCPAKEETIKNYVENNIIKKRYYYQMQLQMLLTKRKKGLFCIASPNFENNKYVDIYELDFNEEDCKEIMLLSETFWKQHIFPNIF